MSWGAVGQVVSVCIVCVVTSLIWFKEPSVEPHFTTLTLEENPSHREFVFSPTPPYSPRLLYPTCTALFSLLSLQSHNKTRPLKVCHTLKSLPWTAAAVSQSALDHYLSSNLLEIATRQKFCWLSAFLQWGTLDENKQVEGWAGSPPKVGRSVQTWTTAIGYWRYLHTTLDLCFAKHSVACFLTTAVYQILIFLYSNQFIKGLELPFMSRNTSSKTRSRARRQVGILFISDIHSFTITFHLTAVTVLTNEIMTESLAALIDTVIPLG